MAFAHGKGAGVFVADFDLSGDLTQYNWSKSRQLVDVTTFGNDNRVFLAGIGEGRISVQGVWNPSVSDIELIAIDGVETVITASPTAATAIGDRAHMVNGLLENFQPRAPVNDAVRFSSGVTASAGAYPGVILHHNNQESSADDFASVDGAAQSSNGATAFLHVTQFSGTDATVTIEDSSNDSTFGSLVAFTQVTGTTSEKVTASGTVERYARVALTGTFTTITFVVAFARHRQ